MMVFHPMSLIRWTIGRCVHRWTYWTNRWIKVIQNPWVSRKHKSNSNNKLTLFVLNLNLLHSLLRNSYRRIIIRRIPRPRRHRHRHRGEKWKTVNERRREPSRKRHDHRHRWTCIKFSNRNPRWQVHRRRAVHFSSTDSRPIPLFPTRQIVWPYRVRSFKRTKLEEANIGRKLIHLIDAHRRRPLRAPIKRSKHLCSSILPRTVPWTVESKWRPVQVSDHFWLLLRLDFLFRFHST